MVKLKETERSDSESSSLSSGNDDDEMASIRKNSPSSLAFPSTSESLISEATSSNTSVSRIVDESSNNSGSSVKKSRVTASKSETALVDDWIVSQQTSINDAKLNTNPSPPKDILIDSLILGNFYRGVCTEHVQKLKQLMIVKRFMFPLAVFYVMKTTKKNTRGSLYEILDGAHRFTAIREYNDILREKNRHTEIITQVKCVIFKRLGFVDRFAAMGRFTPSMTHLQMSFKERMQLMRSYVYEAGQTVQNKRLWRSAAAVGFFHEILREGHQNVPLSTVKNELQLALLPEDSWKIVVNYLRLIETKQIQIKPKWSTKTYAVPELSSTSFWSAFLTAYENKSPRLTLKLLSAQPNGTFLTPEQVLAQLLSMSTFCAHLEKMNQPDLVFDTAKEASQALLGTVRDDADLMLALRSRVFLARFAPPIARRNAQLRAEQYSRTKG